MQVQRFFFHFLDVELINDLYFLSKFYCIRDIPQLTAEMQHHKKTAEIMNHNNSATKSQATKYYHVAKMICKKYDLHQFKVTTMDKLSSIRNHVPTPKILSSPSTTIMTNNDRQPHTVQPCTTSGIHTLVWEPQLYTESVLNRKMYLFYTLKKSFIYLYIY